MGVFKDDPASMRKILSNALSGWNYWYNWVIVLPAELSASAVLINFWDSEHLCKSLCVLPVTVPDNREYESQCRLDHYLPGMSYYQ